jgi:hypothetical protein
VSRFISNKRIEDNRTKEALEVGCLLIAVTSHGKQDVNWGGNKRGDKAEKRKPTKGERKRNKRKKGRE